jgi:Yip1 domain
MSFFQRLQGVFFEPKRVFDALSAKPVWIDAVVVVLVALIAFNLVIAPYMQQDNLRLMKDNAALKDRMGEEAYALMIERTEHPSTAFRIVQTFVSTPLFFLAALLLQSLLLLIMGRLLSTQGTYVQVLAALVHASFVDKLLGNSVRLALALTRKSVFQTSTGLALLFPKMEVTSTAYIMLAQVDLFQLWMFGILAFGLAAIFKISLKKALTLSYGMWFLKALANIGIGVISMSFMR